MACENERITELEHLIEKYSDSYYGKEAEISDDVFDLLWDELKSLAPDSPVLKKIGTAQVSSHDVDGFPKVEHLIPMGSQSKASGPGEFLDWAKKREAAGSGKFIVQYKLDGASLELQYKKGNLIRAVTRGDGLIGDDITANARRMNGVIPKLDVQFSGGVRGEVIMTRLIHKQKYSSKANCRNAANGLMRRKDAAGCEDLTYYVFDASAGDKEDFFSDEINKIEWLKKRKFNTAETKIFTSPGEIVSYRDETAVIRDSLPFDIDGLVVKCVEIDMEDLRKARPEKQIAFKFEPETAFSILREVQWSESGATYTPIGIIDPVRLAGTTVKRANLNNPDMIRLMNLKLGSTVSVVKRGEIIPKIEGLAPVSKPCKTEEIPFPEICSACNTKLTDIGTRLYCPNPGCKKRLLHRLEKWVNVLDIRELGEKLLLQLFEKNRVKHIHDLYTLTPEELAEYDRMGEISAAKVIRHIQTKRELSLAVFTAGFDLEGIAKTTMEKIAAAGFDTLEKLRKASKDEFAAIHGLGEITASVIVEGLKECTKEMDAVLKSGVISITKPQSKNLPLSGLSFCFTGEMKSIKRSEAEDKITALGALTKASVVKGLSYLVTNDPVSGSAKNKKARELGIPIINEEEFLVMLSGSKKLPVQNELFFL